mmetsp:Transcript_3901/g.5360  ORF Transcript_3901/g.5360 Transcript_3901/m.5360 type:complete len:236 (+) Transcript_3901:3-710(+)
MLFLFVSLLLSQLSNGFIGNVNRNGIAFQKTNALPKLSSETASKSLNMSFETESGIESTGLHGSGNKFLPVVQIQRGEHYPRIICVAGLYPGLTSEELNSPTSSEAAEPGMWQYDFSDITEEGSSYSGTVAIPGSELTTSLIDPVIIVADSQRIGISLPGKKNAEVLMIVDRKENEFEAGKFFVWGKNNSEVIVRWFDEEPTDLKILGKVMMVHVPYFDAHGGSSGWMEEEEEYY